MKTNVKILMSLVVTVSIGALCAAFCLRGQMPPVRGEIDGPIGWEVLAIISGGASEDTDRCGETSVFCGNGWQVVTCNQCNGWSQTTGWTYPEGVAYHQYAMTGSFTAVGDGPSHKSAQVNNFDVNCDRTVSCVPGPVVNPGHCAGGSCSSGGLGVCAQYFAPAILPPYTTYHKGNCIDP